MKREHSIANTASRKSREKGRLALQSCSMENPYESPALEATNSEPSQPDGSLLRSFAAVMVGGTVVDYIGTQLTFAIITGCLRVQFQGNPNDVFQAYQSAPVQAIAMTGGVFCSFFGGLAAAWIARQRPVLHAVLSVTVAHVMLLPHLFTTQYLTSPLRILIMTLCFLAAAYAGKMMAGGQLESGEAAEEMASN